jgi:hypothetical protein
MLRDEGATRALVASPISTTSGAGAVMAHLRRGPVAIVLGLLAAFLLGWWLPGRVASINQPVLTREFFSGTISAVDATGASICVIADTSGALRCGRPMTNPGNRNLQVGDHVRVEVEEIKVAGGGQVEAFVIYSPAPPL